MNSNPEEAARIAASGWWRDEPNPELEGLPDHIVKKLEGAGIRTPQAVREAGPEKLRAIEGLGQRALAQIKEWLRSLDQEP